MLLFFLWHFAHSLFHILNESNRISLSHIHPWHYSASSSLVLIQKGFIVIIFTKIFVRVELLQLKLINRYLTQHVPVNLILVVRLLSFFEFLFGLFLSIDFLLKDCIRLFLVFLFRIFLSLLFQLSFLSFFFFSLGPCIIILGFGDRNRSFLLFLLLHFFSKFFHSCITINLLLSSSLRPSFLGWLSVLTFSLWPFYFLWKILRFKFVTLLLKALILSIRITCW